MIRRILLPVIVLLVGVAGTARARSLEIEDFRAAIEVRPDGVVAVEETIRVAFRGRFNGILRDIRYGYADAGGVCHGIRIEVVAVEDGEGDPLEFRERREGPYVNLRIRVPGADDAVRTVVIRYLARDVLRERHAEIDHRRHAQKLRNGL